MDHLNLCRYLTDSILTDLELTLIDENENTLVLNVHKLVLSINCPYFETLFCSQFIDSKKENLKLLVPDIYVVKDIIHDFYKCPIKCKNYPAWLYELKKFVCQNFLCLETNIEILHNIIVPTTGFDKLLDTIDLIGYDSDTISLLVGNMPDNYDLTKLPMELIRQMFDVPKFNMLYQSDKNGIFKVGNGSNSFSITDNTLIRNGHFEFSSIHNKIIYHHVCDIYVYDLLNYTTNKFTNPIDHTIKSIVLTPDQEYVIYDSSPQIISKFNFISMEIIESRFAPTGEVVNDIFSSIELGHFGQIEELQCCNPNLLIIGSRILSFYNVNDMLLMNIIENDIIPDDLYGRICSSSIERGRIFVSLLNDIIFVLSPINMYFIKPDTSMYIKKIHCSCFYNHDYCATNNYFWNICNINQDVIAVLVGNLLTIYNWKLDKTIIRINICHTECHSSYCEIDKIGYDSTTKLLFVDCFNSRSGKKLYSISMDNIDLDIFTENKIMRYGNPKCIFGIKKFKIIDNYKSKLYNNIEKYLKNNQ
ncbi:putative BTB/POZ domain-containing protein [Acanthamoeba polyphaga mimivirus]|uniref:BTB/POZ domain-containing protein n=1 Tax=Acanthamoeba polyphaga mimivirus Kroon TaxID=3069720 RepID=A0A0G2Y5U0_9VIRU|nr:putative BTB/POZ domain-containing protein [Acanthamoeba polyphaga mimivirus]AKI79954.1 putative BTB/POZ domain-containing protein [Acanthamoeba polyphaga mimivirus Kroon]